jgi:hypothetical protein
LRENAAAAQAYVRATRAGLAWTFDPANRAAASALLAARTKLAPADADAMVRVMLAPGGLDRRGAIDVAAVRNVLALRATYARPATPLAAPAAYLAGMP